MLARHYPRGYATRVERNDWVSQHDAGIELQVAIFTIGMLIANGHLEPAETEGHLFGIEVQGPEMGVTRRSLEIEKRWRRETPRWRRWRRGVKNTRGWLLSGL